jgi:hypothetical protein
MGHLTPSHDHLWVCLDAATLTGCFLAAGAALCRPAEPDHRLPWFPVPEERGLLCLCLSLGMTGGAI